LGNNESVTASVNNDVPEVSIHERQIKLSPEKTSSDKLKLRPSMQNWKALSV